MIFAQSAGAVCQWHTPSADRAEGETLGPVAEASQHNYGLHPRCHTGYPFSSSKNSRYSSSDQ